MSLVFGSLLTFFLSFLAIAFVLWAIREGIDALRRWLERHWT